jgi:CheY-like chemotaxis protein
MRGPIDLAAMVLGMKDLLDQSLGPSFTLEIELAPHLPAVVSDPVQLESALLNVVINARDAMPRGGGVTLSATRERLDRKAPDLAAGDYVRLAVTDTGEGMSEETLARATEPFFTTKRVGKGTGLGLAMAHGLMRQTGGCLRLKSRIGVGSEVEFWLPVAAAKPDEAAIDPVWEVQSPAVPLAILAADDDELVLFNMAAMLEDLGHRVIQARSGADALRALAEAERVDLLITDQIMSDMTGTTLAQRVVAERPGLRVVLASGYAELPPGEGDGLTRLAKPFSQRQLAEAIKRAMVVVPDQFQWTVPG